MVSFFLNIWRLLVALWYGVKEDEQFRALLFLLITLLAGATYFYWEVEGWSIIDSLYFSIMTTSTIGYGDLVPTTTFSKIFTIMFAILSIGVFVAVVSKIVQITLQHRKHSRQKLRQHKDNKHEGPG
jgi:voltage-gated potassium channel Kch